MGARKQRKNQTKKRKGALGYWNGLMKENKYDPDHPAFAQKEEVVLPPGCKSRIGNQKWASLIRWVEEQRKKDVSASCSLRVRVPAFRYLYELSV